MAIVTGVREYRGIVRVQMDGMEFAAIRREDFDRFPLEEGDAVDEEEYIDRIAAMQMKDASAAVLSALSHSDKTVAELKKALLRKGFAQPAADAAIALAMERRYVDDKRYANRAVELSAGKTVGIYALKRKLREKGISEEDAEEALGSIDEDQQREACKRMLEKIRYRYEDKPPREARAKCSQALARRGFSWDTISAVMDGAFSGDDEW